MAGDVTGIVVIWPTPYGAAARLVIGVHRAASPRARARGHYVVGTTAGSDTDGQVVSV